MSGPERTMMFTMPATAQGRLVGLEGSVKGRVFPLSTGTFIIGRGESCDMPISDPGVSREHAKIVAEADAYLLFDMESRNGTFVNGKPTRNAKLQEGDEVRICAAAFRFTFLEVAGLIIPPEMSLDDDTNPNTDLGDVAASPSARLRPSRVPTVTSAGPPPAGSAERSAAVVGVADGGLRTVKIVVAIALVAAVVAVGAAVGVVVVLRRAPVVRASEVVVPAPKPVAADVPVVPVAPVAPVPVAPVPVVPGSVVPVPVAARADGTSSSRPRAAKPPKPSAPATSTSEWIAARTGPELVRAPVAGEVTSVASAAVTGQQLVVVGGVSVKATATGALSGAVKVGETVRKGQVLGRIAESRVRADVPSSLVRRAKKGAKIELQLADGSTKPATITEVVGATVFVDAAGGVTSVRFPRAATSSP